MKIGLFTIVVILVLLSACNSRTGNEDNNPLSAVYPMFVDDNNNGINDYVEEETHYSGSDSRESMESPESTESPESMPSMRIGGIGLYEHAFEDSDGDGICDYAQNGSNTWHGPGFVDEDNNGISDYWDENSLMHNQHEGMFFQNQNQNMVNDYFEKQWHQDSAHDFVDEDGDGICDYAQDGSNTWHGPGLVDEDDDGVCDCWQPGGKGHGHGHSVR